MPTSGLAEISQSDANQPDRQTGPRFAPGDLLANRFRIVRLISKGGMGEVYEAEDLELGECVAVKTILPSIAANPVALEQFKREIQLARKVTHPNVCRIFDLVYDPRPSGPVAFLTMELLEGITLSSRLESKGSLSLHDALPLVRQMAEGLNAAHRVGVVHQDFKSSNVILVDGSPGQSSRVVITDFGLAHNLRAASSGGGRSVGTPAYKAPEQIEGGPVSPATDVYGFGVVLYELLTGRWPYNAKTIEELESKKLNELPLVPSKYAPELPPRAERAILRCLARKPEDRFDDPRQAVAALETPPRNWLPWAAAGIVLVTLGSVGGYRWRKSAANIGEPTVAVLGFTNNSGDPKYDWLATELSESLNTDLGGSKGIHSVPTDEVASVKTELSVAQSQSLEHEDLSTVRQALAANYLLLGRYAVPEGSHLEMDVRMQDAHGKIVSDVHESGLAGDYRRLSADAASQIRDRLGSSRLSDTQVSELQNLYPADQQASQLYFQGLDKLRAYDATAALSLLKKAAERDPDNISIHLALADAWSQLKHDPEAAQEAQKAAANAQSGSLPQEYVVLTQARAAQMNKQWNSAIDDYRSLFLMFPQHLNYGLHLASAQIEGAKPTDALQTLATVSKLSAPMGTDPRIAMSRARAYEAMSDFNSELNAAQTALAEAQQRNARMMQAQAELALCWAHRNMGHVDAAYSACNEAQNLFSVFGDNVSAGVALNDVATWLTDRGQYPQAKQLYDRVIDANQKAGDQKDYAGACVNASMVLIHMGQWQDADDYVARALTAAGPIGDEYDEALAHLNRGEILSNQGSLANAEREVGQALNLARSIEDQSMEGKALSHLAGYQSETNTQRALVTYAEALRLRQQNGDQAGVAICLASEGDVLFRRGDLKGADEKYSEALKIDTQLKDKDAIAHDWASFAEVDFERGNFEAAHEKLVQAVRQFRDDQDTDSESEAASILVRVLVAEGKTQEAEPFVKRMREIAPAHNETSIDSHLGIAEYLKATGDLSGALQQAEPLPAEAKQLGLNFAALKARLELVKLQAREKPRASLLNALASIEREAARMGFNILIVQAKRIQL